MRTIRVRLALATLAFVLTNIASVIASPEDNEDLPPASTGANGTNPQSECLNAELPSRVKAKQKCVQQLQQSVVDSNRQIIPMCSISKGYRDCNQPLVEVAAKCSPPSASLFHSINAFMEEFYCAGESSNGKSAFQNETVRCLAESEPRNLPKKCNDVDVTSFNQTDIFFQNPLYPKDVQTSAETLFDCFNTTLRNCGVTWNYHCKTSLAKALPRTGCPSSANNQYVYTSMTVLWWALVVTGLSKLV